VERFQIEINPRYM